MNCPIFTPLEKAIQVKTSMGLVLEGRTDTLLLAVATSLMKKNEDDSQNFVFQPTHFDKLNQQKKQKLDFHIPIPLVKNIVLTVSQ